MNWMLEGLDVAIEDLDLSELPAHEVGYQGEEPREDEEPSDA